MANTAAGGEPCEGMDVGFASLCAQYAADASQHVDPLAAVSVSLPTLCRVLVLPTAIDRHVTPALPAWASAPVRPPPDPLFLATLRLRV